MDDTTIDATTSLSIYKLVAPQEPQSLSIYKLVVSYYLLREGPDPGVYRSINPWSPRPPRVHRSINSCSRSIPESSGELPPPAPRDTVLPRFLSGVLGLSVSFEQSIFAGLALGRARSLRGMPPSGSPASLAAPVSARKQASTDPKATQAAEAEKEREMGSEREKERREGERGRGVAWVLSVSAVLLIALKAPY